MLTYDDDHGDPALSSGHGVSAGGARDPVYGTSGPPDAYDFFFVWKVFDALRDYAFHGTHRAYALGDTPRHRFLGRGSDGTPVRRLKNRDSAPIRP